MKSNKKLISIILVGTMALSSFVGCSDSDFSKKNASETEESTKAEESTIAPAETDAFSIRKQPASEGVICPIKIGDDISTVFDLYEFEDGDYVFDYEYDPYHDGCTEINTGIYTGTLTDFDEEDVLDYCIIIYYKQIDGYWVMMNLNEEDPEKLQQEDDVCIVYIDIVGPGIADEDYPLNSVASVDIVK